MARRRVKDGGLYGSVYVIQTDSNILLLNANIADQGQGQSNRAYHLHTSDHSFSMALSEEDLLHLFAGFINIKEEHYGENF